MISLTGCNLIGRYPLGHFQNIFQRYFIEVWKIQKLFSKILEAKTFDFNKALKLYLSSRRYRIRYDDRYGQQHDMDASFETLHEGIA